MDKTDEDIKQCIKKITELKETGKFNNYIEYMVFPHFKNLEFNSKINLDFPMTVLIGKNGSGKSSTLHAFYGAPKGHSCGDFWFSTEIDPIIETGEDARNRFFYGYREKQDDKIKEVRLARIKRSGSIVKKEDPDYWETTRPVKQDGMIAISDRTKRNSPVRKEVIYIDFRGELGAFDKYFYFGEPSKGKKQDFLRRKSVYLKRVFNEEALAYSPETKGIKVRNPVILLTARNIDKINEILGKNYTDIKMVKHKLYDTWGVSVLVKNYLQAEYSEANAGSGEIAVIKLVYKLMNAKPFSLILLDEVETSLHPSAQLKMKLFLLQQILEKKHQIIISSHSKALIEYMPKESLKLFNTLPDGKFYINNSVTPQEAFYDIEDCVYDSKNIICEDIVAKILIEQILGKMGKEHFFKIQFVHGGAETILSKHIPIYSLHEELKESIFILLDGDKDKNMKCTIEELPNTDLVNLTTLEGLLFSVTGTNIKPFVDGSNGRGREDQKRELILKYLSYHKDNVYYLPEHLIPEVIILKSKYANTSYLKIIEQYKNIDNENAKNIICEIAIQLFGTSNSNAYDSTIRLLAFQWVQEKDTNYNKIKSTIDNIFERCAN
jgi:predicted ATPase